jgi:hypothetical protein
MSDPDLPRTTVRSHPAAPPFPTQPVPTGPRARPRDARTERWRASRRPRGPWGGRSFPIALGVLVLAPFLTIGLPSVRAAPIAPTVTPALAGAPSLNGYFIVGDGAALVAVGYVSWVGSWTQAGNGTSVYSPQFDLYYFNLHPYAVTVTTAVEVSGTFVQNVSVYVPPLNEASQTLTLPTNPAWSGTTLWFDGTPYWTGQTTTPAVFLPTLLDIQGFADLFSLWVISFMVIVAGSGLALARFAMSRAVWAPRMRLIMWAHLPIFALVGAVFADYQGVVSTFAGWSPLVYPWFLIPLFFVTGLWTYRRGGKILVLSGRLTERDELGYGASVLRVGPLPSGYLVYIDPSWWGFWARFWRAYTYVEDPDPSKPRPWLAPVRWVPSPTMSARERQRARRQFYSPTSYAEALTRFPLFSKEKDGGGDEFGYVAWAKLDTLPDVVWPRLRWSRLVPKPAVLQADPNGGPPIVVKPAREVRRLTKPHYVGAGKQAAIELDDVHTAPAHAVWARFASRRDLGRLLSKYKGAVAAWSEGFENRVQAEVEAELRSFALLRNRVARPVTEAEAEDEARAAARAARGPIGSGGGA